MTQYTVEAVATALDDGASKVHDDKFTLRCPLPGHEDKNPSAWIYRHPKTNGIMLGCAVCGHSQETFRELCRRQGIVLQPKAEDKKPVIRDLYLYFDYEGNFTRAVKERYERADGGSLKKSDKSRWGTYFREVNSGSLTLQEPRRPDLAYLPLYNGHLLGDAERVFVVEGEKDCETLRSRMVPAVAIPTSSGTFWCLETERLLEGREVLLIPDNDAVGDGAMDKFGAACCRAGIDVKRLELPVKRAGEDVTDWFLEYQGTAEKLWKIADAAPFGDLADFEWRSRLSWSPDGAVRTSTFNAQVLMRYAPGLRGRLSYDVFLHRILWDGQPIDMDDLLVEVRAVMSGLVGFETSSDAPLKEVLIGSAKNKKVDSLIAHVEALPAWDGVERLDTWLADYCGVDGDFGRLAGRKFLIGMIARAMDPGCKFDTALVLEGLQGPGKSTLCSILGGPFYSGDMPDLRDRAKASHAIQGAWLIEDAEMDSSSKAENKRLKGFLSTMVDRFRPPYGRNYIDAPRRCVFIITTNYTEAYFADETGGRRLWPVLCEGDLQLKALAEDRDQLLAEAYAAWLFGEKYWFDYASTEAEIQDQEISERSFIHQASANEDVQDVMRAFPGMRRGEWTTRKQPLNAVHLKSMYDQMLTAGRIPPNTNADRYMEEVRKVLRFKRWKIKIIKFKGRTYRLWTDPAAKPPYIHNLA